MAVVPITFNGIVYPKNKKDPPFPATFVGQAWISGLHVDISPPDPPPAYPPIDAHPEHPIVLPPEGVIPPDISAPEEGKPPPADGGWGWSPDYGWGYFPGTGGAGPKKR
jgi:hypothetical protein